MKTIVKIDRNSSISRINCPLPDDVSGIGYSQTENSVIFYSSANGVFGFVNDNGKIDVPSRRMEVVHPIGICCDKWGLCVLQFSDDMAWNFDQSYRSGRRLFGKRAFNTILNSIPKDVNNLTTCQICRTDRNSIMVAMPWTNKILMLNENQTKSQIGSGKNGFLSSASLKASMFSAPSGVCYDHESSTTIISDTGNSIIRLIKNNKEISFIGMPNQIGFDNKIGTEARLSYPTTIRVSKGVVSFVDNNLVRTFKISNLAVETLYSSSNHIIDLALGNGSVYVLEEK